MPKKLDQKFYLNQEPKLKPIQWNHTLWIISIGKDY